VGVGNGIVYSPRRVTKSRGNLELAKAQCAADLNLSDSYREFTLSAAR
jgi:hypothetical protein